MPIVSDDKRQRKFTPRPSRRVSNPMRTYTFKLGGKQADWLDNFIRQSEQSTSEVIRYLMQRVIRKKSGIAPEDVNAVPEIDIQGIKDEITNAVESHLRTEFQGMIAELLNDKQRAQTMHNLTQQAVNGEEISEREIANMLEGFSYD